MKIYWLGLRTEDVEESFESWCEYAEESSYNWHWEMCYLDSNNFALSKDRSTLQKHLTLLADQYPDEVYKIFEVEI